MKWNILILFVLAVFTACDKTVTEEEVYVPVEVTVTVSDPEGLIVDGSDVAVMAHCVRSGVETSMSVNSVARFTAHVSSGKTVLSPASEEDRIYAEYDDSGISLTVVSPWSESVSLETDVPQEQTYGQKLPSAIYGTVTMDSVSSSVYVPVSERPLCSVLSLEIPADIIAEKTVTLSEMSLSGVKMTFPDGLVMSENRIVDVAVTPGIVPEGGIGISFTDTDGSTFFSTILSGPADAGLELGFGCRIDAYVPSADPFKPCTFPVVFPLGRNPSARNGYYNYSDDQPDWNNMGIWRCFAQKQAYATWNQVSEPSATMFQRRELVNTGDIGSIGLKGIWTGDYFEFVIPVENIGAGSVVSFEAPFYGRQQPVFWTVEWLDGDEWANDVREITSWDGSTVMEASFCTRLYGTVINYSFRLQNPIERGNLKVRLICTDGRYQADTNTGTVMERELPYNDGSAYQSPFYFYCDGSGVNAFTWNLREGSDKPETGTNEDLTVMDPEWDWTD